MTKFISKKDKKSKGFKKKDKKPKEFKKKDKKKEFTKKSKKQKEKLIKCEYDKKSPLKNSILDLENQINKYLENCNEVKSGYVHIFSIFGTSEDVEKTTERELICFRKRNPGYEFIWKKVCNEAAIILKKKK